MGDFSLAVLSLAACVLAASALAKLRNRRAYRAFRDGLRETGLLSPPLLPRAAAALASAEATVAAALIAAAVLTMVAAPGAVALAESALAAAGVLLVLLTAGVAMVIRRGTQARCACFGASSRRPLGPAHLARNLSLLAIACTGLVAAPLAHGSPAVAGAVLAAGAGVVAALLFIRWDDIADLFGPPLSTAHSDGRAFRRQD